jgi:acyl dehydratase
MQSLPFVALPPLPGLLIRGAATLLRRQQLVLPNIGFAGHFELAGIDMGHVGKYRKFFDSRSANVPLTYFYLLAQRAQLALMLDERFPHAIPGLIHTRNDLRLHAIPQAGSCLEMEVSVLPGLEVGDVQKIVFNVEMKQSGLRVVSCVSEYRVPRRNRIKQAGQAEPEKLPESFSQIGWAFEKSHIRRYAMVSGDYNPIHLSSLLARAFGFRRAIAHGMYSVGRAAANIESQTSRPVIAISADFMRPIPLPAQATFGFESMGTTQGAYGVLLAGEQKLALGGVWEIGTER